MGVREKVCSYVLDLFNGFIFVFGFVGSIICICCNVGIFGVVCVFCVCFVCVLSA